jgi:Na+/proline symporter
MVGRTPRQAFPTDLLTIAKYFVFVVGIGLVLKRSMKRSEDFLLPKKGRRA